MPVFMSSCLCAQQSLKEDMKEIPSSATPFRWFEGSAWSLTSGGDDEPLFSTEWQSLAEECGSDPVEFVRLFRGVVPGRWPCSVGGRLLEVGSTLLKDGKTLVLLHPMDASRATALLDALRGSRKTLLCTPAGRLVSMSSHAPEEMDRTAETVQSLFDPGSRPAVQAALKNCSATGRMDEFLASSGSIRDGRGNWVVSMEAVPAPGKLILCDLSVPSLALVDTGAASDELLRAIVEENPAPTVMLDKSGLITKLNAAAVEQAREAYGDIRLEGTYFWKWVAEEYREKAKANHDKRAMGYFIPASYPLVLKPDLKDDSPLMDISVFPLAKSGDSIVFMQRRLPPRERCGIPKTAVDAMRRSPESPEALLRFLMNTTEADGAALVTPGGTVTVGSAETLTKEMPQDVEARVWAESGGTWSLYQPMAKGGVRGTLVLGGLKTGALLSCGEAALQLASLHPVFTGVGGRVSRVGTVLEHIGRITGLAAAGSEGMEKALRELASACNADKGIKAEISSDGTMLLPVVSVGIQGDLPGLPMNSGSIMAWASVHGRSIFLADPMLDARMSAVFPDSGGEIAAPVTREGMVTGVVLLATSSQEGFQRDALGLLETAAGIFSALEQAQASGSREFCRSPIQGELPESAVSELDHRLSASSAALLHAARRLSAAPAGSGATEELLNIIMESAGHVADSSSLLSEWLRAAALGGKPDMQWLDPAASAREVVERMRETPSSSAAALHLTEDDRGFMACFDPSWFKIALGGLVRTAVEISEEGGTVRVSLAAGGEHWSVQVESGGGGIPAEAIPGLFKGWDGETQGRLLTATALNLPLAKTLTEAMGGTITVFSSPDMGTRFTLRFKSGLLQGKPNWN